MFVQYLNVNSSFDFSNPLVLQRMWKECQEITYHVEQVPMSRTYIKFCYETNIKLEGHEQR